MARGDDLQHPQAKWYFRAASRSAQKGYEELCRQARGATSEAWVQIRADPRRHTERQHRLKGKLGTGSMDGELLEQWEYEVTGGGRMRYLIQDKTKTVWLVHAGTGHPKDTE